MTEAQLRRGGSRPGGGPAAASLAALLAAAGAATAQAKPPSPPQVDYVAPAVGAPPASAPAGAAPAAMSYAEQLARATALTKQERTVLDAVRDRVERLEETGFYVMLGVARRAPRLDETDWEQLDTVAYASLLADPNHYRARPLQMRLLALRVNKLVAGLSLTPTQFFPKGSEAWEIRGLCANSAYQDLKPVLVYSVADPSPALGQPDEVDNNGQRIYKDGREVRLAGLFYKIYRTMDEGTAKRPPQLRDYPVIMAWQVERAGAGATRRGGAFPDLGKLGPMFLVIILLGAGFILLRLRLGRQKKQDSHWRRSRPRQERPQGNRDGQRRPVQDEAEEESGQVDPELTSVVEEYLHEKEDDEDGTDRRR